MQAAVVAAEIAPPAPKPRKKATAARTMPPKPTDLGPPPVGIDLPTLYAKAEEALASIPPRFLAGVPQPQPGASGAGSTGAQPGEGEAGSDAVGPTMADAITQV